MREIKYRAWDKIDKQIVSVANIHFDPDGTITSILVWNKDDTCSTLKRGCFVLIQFTGLKDKNEVEIYEGDKIKATGAGGIVVWYEGGFWVKRSNNGQLELYLVLDAARQPEVIDNIYQNPGLLKT